MSFAVYLAQLDKLICVHPELVLSQPRSGLLFKYPLTLGIEKCDVRASTYAIDAGRARTGQAWLKISSYEL